MEAFSCIHMTTPGATLAVRIYLGESEPVFLLRGRHDLFHKSEKQLRKRFPHSQETWFDHSGHFPWIEEPESFRDVLTAFYQRVAPALIIHSKVEDG